MRNRSYDERVAEVTRRRLEALAAELGSELGTGLGSAPDPSPGPDTADTEPDSPETGPGRHARRPVRGRRRLGLWLAERLPAAAHDQGPGRLRGVRGRLDLGAAHLGLVALVLAGGLLLTAWLVLRSSPSGTAAPPRVTTPSATADPGSGTTSSSLQVSPGGGASASPTVELVVDVVGKVRKPGIAVLPAGSRVVDALKAAGGARPGTDLVGLNLARPLADGEQIVVGRPAGAAPAVAPPAAGSSSSPAALVNLNTADQVALESLPGVGPVTAAAILQWRTEHGAFTAVEELLEVSGIGDATLAEIAPHVTL